MTSLLTSVIDEFNEEQEMEEYYVCREWNVTPLVQQRDTN